MKSTALTLLYLCFYFLSFAQSDERNTLWMEYIEELSDNEIESILIENLYEELSYLSEHPFDLNVVTKTDLERLPFLSVIQIENLLYYIYKYGPLVNIYELKNVESLDYQTIRYLLPFVYVGETNSKETMNVRQAIKYGKSEILLRMDDGLQQKAGYKKANEEEKTAHPNWYYLGEKYHLSLRYGFQYKDHIQFGLVGEKDPGEAFWNANHKGFDFYSAHFLLKNIGVVEGLYLGDYRLAFGQGLVLNTDFSMGKTSDVINIGKNSSGIKRHFSTNETDFFRGAAVALKFDQVRLRLFYSHRDLDATADSTTIFTFKTDGYNRTINDLEKRRQATVNIGGVNIQWRSEVLNLGLTAAAYNFGGKELNPDYREYNRYYLRGDENFNAGIDYTYQRKRYQFQGETAISRNGGVATLNHLLLTPASFVNLILSYRRYNYDYQSLYSRSLGEASTVQNESGFYYGMKFFLLKGLELAAYMDIFRFPWLKYGIDAPSSGKDVLIQINYNPSSIRNMNLRYKFKEKEKNFSGKVTSILPYNLHRWRYQLNHQLPQGFSFRTQLDYNLYLNTDKRQTTGWAISQLAGYKPANANLQLDLSVAYFNAVDWDNRVSSYERNVLYAFNMPVLYGEGWRYYFVLKWNIYTALIVYIKAATTHYFNVNKISSGLEEISGREKTDINCLIKFKF